MLYSKIFKQCSIAVAVMSVASLANAEDNGWSGKGEAGISVVSGNSDSEIITAGFDIAKKSGKWEHNAKLSVLKSESTIDIEDEDGNTTPTEQDTADSLLVGWVSKYSLSDRSYVFGDLRYLDDKFDSFEGITTYSLGYGYKVVVGEQTNWDISAGLGYRDTEYDDRLTDAQLAADGLERDIAETTFVATSLFSHKFNNATEFTNETRLEGADANTYAQNIAALSVSMSDALALKVKYDIRHNTDPAPGDTSTDKITSVNVVYSF